MKVELVAAPATPKTEAATFVITPKDVGSKAVRVGHMAELEQDRHALLLTCKAILRRIREEKLAIGAAHEFMLESVIKAVDAA